MAALLDERSTGVAVEPVPVADLVEERETVFTDGDHADLADGPVTNLGDHPLRGGHVPVFQAHPHHPAGDVGRVRAFDDLAAVFNGRAQRLLHEEVDTGIEGVEEDRVVGVVGGRDDDHIAQTGCEELMVIGEGDGGPIGSEGSTCPFEALGMWIADGGDDGVVEMADVDDVLASHHPRADDAVAQERAAVGHGGGRGHGTSVGLVVAISDPLDTSSARIVAGRAVGGLGFGCWRLTTASTDDATRVVEGAVDLGCTLVDTADVYGLDWGGSGWGTCEERLGEVLAARPTLRDRIFLVTKGGIRPGVPYDSSPASLTEACEASLRRLGVASVDLYMVHRPDLLTHPAEVAGALLSLRERGLIGAIGVSNHTAAQVAALEVHLGEPVAAIQPEFSVVATGAARDGVLDRAMHHRTAVLAWSPLGGGRVVTGDGVDPPLLAVLDEIARDHGTTRSVVALAFVLAHPSAPVALLGTQRLENIADATAALGFGIARSEWYAILQASEGRPLP